MSLRWTEHVRVVLHPDRVDVVRASWRGVIGPAVSLPCSSDAEVLGSAHSSQAGESASQAEAERASALVITLGQALVRLGASPRRIDVVATNSLVRHLLLPWDAALAEPNAAIAWARHQLARAIGDGAASWDVRTSRPKLHQPLLVSALPLVLLEGLRSGHPRLQLMRLRPQLAVALRQSGFPRSPAGHWLASIDPGRLCLARLDRRGVQQLRTVSYSGSPVEALKQWLEREERVPAASGLPPLPLVVHAPEHPGGWPAGLARSPLRLLGAGPVDADRAMAWTNWSA